MQYVYNFINKFDKIYYYSRCIRKRLNRENCKKKRKEKNCEYFYTNGENLTFFSSSLKMY